MRVFVVTRGVPCDDNPMLGIFEFDQAKALKEAGCEVVILSVDLRSIRRRRKFGYVSYAKDGICIEEMSIPMGNVPIGMRRYVGTLALKQLLRKARIRYGKEDIIHSHFINISYITDKAADADDIRVITEHSSELNEELDHKTIEAYKRVYMDADLVIAVSESLKRRIHTVFGVECIRISNIVDTEIFNCQLKSVKNERDLFTFITVAGLKPNKRINLLVEAVGALREKGANVRLLIAGEGPERGRLERLINEKGLQDHVILLGLLERSVISNYMKEADCFVLASRKETFGVAYIEALASGLPVIATKCGGPEDFVTEENGILIPVDDNEKLLSAMDHMMQIIDTFDAAKISEMIKRRFSSSSVAAELIGAYSKLLSDDIKYEEKMKEDR